MRIVRSRGVGRTKPRCAASVRPSRWRPHDKDLCDHVADFVVDGSPRCRAHAGQLALEWVINHPADD